MTRIAIVDNTKLKDMDRKKHIQSKCPVNRTGKECIYFEGEKLLIDEKLCTGCGICPKLAPEAIRIINLPEALTKQPVHRYGKNQFVLYNLPTPLFGKVVGILGRNGIGKSTALKIIAGLLKPNLGNIDKDGTYDDLIDYFKGTETQRFFEQVREGKIVISYKPQHVDLIPKTTKGNVRNLLEQVDEKGKLMEIAEELQLTTVLNRDISSISGGELQRVAIAATVLKKANLYIFDEPTSYLDIKQRLRISKFIKSLATEDTAVVVVEHDLIVLDYVADLIHLMYGQQGTFGIVSGVKTNRTGINVYLAGYLREENIRFRDKPIAFEKKSPEVLKRKEALVSWEGIKKQLETFSLTAPSGKVIRKAVTGLLGENGIGKTSFVKILAGVIEQDEGEVSSNVKVSYKAQYLDSQSDELVMQVLQQTIKKYNTQLILPLELKPLLVKQVNQLSGGELQRVAIAKCLSADARLYLLDEPSAYLDIEQRITVSKLIKELMEQRGTTALVVDHDLLFLDYLSDDLIVCNGEPAITGTIEGPYLMEDGMNQFLSDVNVTLRREPESGRPRVNKEGSVKDREQKASGKFYYA